MSSRLSYRRFLFFMRKRSGLRDRMKNNKIRCESREGIQVRKEIHLPFKLIYRTYLYIKDEKKWADDTLNALISR